MWFMSQAFALMMKSMLPPEASKARNTASSTIKHYRISSRNTISSMPSSLQGWHDAQASLSRMHGVKAYPLAVGAASRM